MASITGESAVTLKNSAKLAGLGDCHHLWELNADCDVLHWLTLLWRTQCGDALNFKKLLQTFEFVFNVLILVLLTKVLSSINAASVYLQSSKDADLKAVHHLKTSFDDMSDYCNNFTDAIDEQQESVVFVALIASSRIYVWQKEASF